MKKFIRIFLLLLLVSSIRVNAQTNKPVWIVNPSAFEQSMEVTIQMFLGTTAITSGGMIGTFVDGGLVGVKDLGSNGPTGKYVFITMVYGNSSNGKTISFKFYDTARDRVYNVTETVIFAADARVGNAVTPQTFHYLLFSDATLSDLKVSGTTITGFNPATLTYTVELPKGTVAVPAVTAATSDINATKAIIPAQALPGSTIVNVTAENGTTLKTYTVNFVFPKNTDATLSDLKIDGTTVTGFAANILTYSKELPHNTTTVPTVTANVTDPLASRVITPAASLPGSTTVVVTAEDGTTKKTYTVNFTIAKDTDARLSNLQYNGITVPGFSAATLSYTVELPHNSTVVPTVTATTTDVNATKAITPAASLPGSTAVVVTAEDGTTTKTYTISFTIAKDTDATLSDLKVSGTTVSGFGPLIVTYHVVLPHNTVIVPVVTATTTDVNATNAITPAASLPGSTTVVVTAEDGTTKKTYTINFTIAKDTDATLSDLKVSGTTVTGFSAATISYTVELPHNSVIVPSVTATTTDVNANKAITPAAALPGSTTVLVTAEDGTTTKTYTISFTIAKDTDATLSDLQVDGSTVMDFNPSVLTYDIELPKGTIIVPTVTATTNDINASKEITPAASLPGSTTVLATAEDGITQITYTISFTVTKYRNKPGWAINPNAFAFDGDITAQVLIDNMVSTAADGILGGFVGTSCRGVKKGGTVGPTGKFGISLRCYSNNASGETLTFQYFDPVLDTVLPILETVEFESNMVLGNLLNPFIMHAITTLTATKSLAAGWNWFSLNLENTDMSIGKVLANLNSQEGDYIKNQTVSATYYAGFGWFGDLTTIDPKEMYKIKVARADSIKFEGHTIDPASMPITIKIGWNWIGYLPQSPKPITDALASIFPVGDDYIKNQTMSNTYYDGFGWFGELEQLAPLDGYMLKSSHTGSLTFLEPLSTTFIDARDGKTYSFVKIGEQTWMAENLAWLPLVRSSSDGSETTSK